MDFLINIHESLYALMGDALYYAIGFLGIIAIIAQWRLYEKANQPGIAAIVPVWNVIVFLRIVGRPASHILYMLIPIYGQLYFIPKVWIEVCQSFGKRTMLDYVLVIAFNGLYILNMGLSYETRYLGPVHGKAPLPPPHKLTNPRPQLA
ncbi:MAG: hypothetical protein JNM31_04040 [Flavobacteriales bacterium]|nr:hypothetical protein [Flavobacteriales bacterium]